jgi:hypothetical protein
MDKHKKLAEDFVRRLAPQLPSVIVGYDDGLHSRSPLDDQYFLAERFARLVQADMEWFEKIISHQPTVGAFYEILLRNTLKELAPIGCEIGTGFVLDPHRRVHSKQLDIIAYDHTKSSPVFRNGELVVVRPSSTMSITEVKKTLRLRDIEQTIDATFFSNLGSRRSAHRSLEGVQNLNIFGFSSKLEPRKLARTLRDYLEKKIHYTRVIAGPEKRKGSIVIENVVLPNIFIRTNRLYILSGLVPTKDIGHFKVGVTVFESFEENGCMGAFLLNALPMFQREQRAFIGSQLLIVKETIETEASLCLCTTTPMEDIDQTFKNDGVAIRDFRVKGKQPFAVLIPKGLRWKELKGFEEFIARVGEHAFQTETPSMRRSKKNR